METGFYKNLEKKFNNNVHYLIKDTSSFLKDNYLFFCLGIIFLWLIYNFYPGAFTGDTFYIFSDVYHNTVGNWHSPLFSRLWQLILFFTDIRGVIWIIQLLSIFVGLYIIAKNISKGILTGFICLLILFITPVFAFIYVVLKDTLLACFIFFVSAIMLDAAISEKKKTFGFYITTVILIFCLYVRPNGCFIAMPLLVAIWMGWKSPIIYRYITCFILVLCIVATTSLVNIKLLKARDEAPDFSLLFFDLVGIAKNIGHPTLPDIPEVPDQMAIINKCYTPLQWDKIAHWDRQNICSKIAIHYFDRRYDGQKVLKQTRSELRHAWISAIIQHPRAYLKHRISHFNRFIDYQGHRPVLNPVFTIGIGYICLADPTDPLTYKVPPPKFWSDFVDNRNLSLGYQLWFHPYVFLLILLFFYLSTLATNDRFNRTLNVVAFSGMIYLIGFLFVGVSSDFRYSYPSLLLSILCILAAFGYYSQKRQVFGTKKMRMIAASVTVPLFLIGIIL
ncbi:MULTISPECIES: hypothetical protein [Bartonella]|uniref:hypothetical protein n=1 Tax=Bartonella TaxID=773 RepID=UPI0018DB6C2C|nr:MULTISPECIES: hypothetical protein [Bartonella]MBH9975996.1 hypothetical protein [Bartonella choladocola]MBI0015663.1 hypothetical protein [Bartonella sp. B10834G3]